MIKFYEKLKERWGADSIWQVLVIVVIFSITGSTALYVRRFVFQQIGFTSETPFWEQAIAWVLVVFPTYQILFLLYGFLLGQFEFVWRFEKKTISRIKKLFPAGPDS
jgi:hypothetical protein